MKPTSECLKTSNWSARFAELCCSEHPAPIISRVPQTPKSTRTLYLVSLDFLQKIARNPLAGNTDAGSYANALRQHSKGTDHPTKPELVSFPLGPFSLNRVEASNRRKRTVAHRELVSWNLATRKGAKLLSNNHLSNQWAQVAHGSTHTWRCPSKWVDHNWASMC